MKAWVLYERGLDGKKRFEGIALTNEAASQWVRAWFPEGCARTSIPHQVIDAKPADQEPT